MNTDERAIVYHLFLWLLTLLFVGLKLTGHIDWSWWLVLAPVWAPREQKEAVTLCCTGSCN